MAGMNAPHRRAVTAVLGPTNTGKTHLAIERMCAHSSGTMGFPLRLLAREVYDRVVAIKGAAQVALVTGEERIVPDTARYTLCTAEAMPRPGSLGGDPAFLALDEAQLGQDRERGHVFTARMLEARGREETMILGSGALAPVVRALLPDAEITARPRFSTLSYDGPRKLSRLPPRSVVVAFSAEEVYAIAEALRRFAGGAAVVMGALSPRTRNAQVAMFQAGEVDYLVATDAIGMGLNLDVTHVAFASLAKFDGQRQRRLTIAEMAQIAGRAGRHQRDGSFGSVGSAAQFTDAEVEAIEEHRFAPIDWLYWREPSPATDSVRALIDALDASPPHPQLRPAPEATDLAVLKALSGDPAVMATARGSDQVARLWATASVPDFTKSGPIHHARLIARLWGWLGEGDRSIPDDWVAGRLKELDQAGGSVEALADRIAKVRTMCYITQRRDWLTDAPALAAEASAVEGRLSDAMHAALTQRFVDRRTTVLLRAIGQGAADVPVALDEDGTVRVDGEAIGRLDGFQFIADPAARAGDRRMLLAAAERHLSGVLAERAAALASAAGDALTLHLADGEAPALMWQGRAVATLVKGAHLLSPRLKLARGTDALDPHRRAAVEAHLAAWVDDAVAHRLGRLLAMAARARDPEAPPELRAVLAALVDRGGVIARDAHDAALRSGPPALRSGLRELGVRVGSLDLHHPDALKPDAQRWLAALSAAWRGEGAMLPPPAGTVLSDAAEPGPAYRRIGARALRVDMVERLARHAHAARMAAVRSAGEADEAAQPPLLQPAPEHGDPASMCSDEGRSVVEQGAASDDSAQPAEETSPLADVSEPQPPAPPHKGEGGEAKLISPS